ncbi:hypothetical protein LJB99_00825 [Deltaproteobacteria bacterium OttesenSCG-928-K17]|nr:hypothetical protein [Deltaproteobacteria bacterium OttesenSCG-928-K17]
MIINFNQPQGSDSAKSGGKGASLSRLTGAGFNVPEGFIISADVYDQWLIQADELPKYLAEIPQDDPAALTAACLRLWRYLAEVPLPEGLEAKIKDRLRAEDDSCLWAVRSSATTEDLAQAAFAGQHATFLGCLKKDIPGLVRNCWISLWTDRAVDYRLRAGFTLTEASMAVVVQRLIDSQAAGVGFSLDPVSGRADQLVFDANYGLGESVVSGEVDVDHYRLNKSADGQGLTIGECIVGLKQQMIVARGSGGASGWMSVPEEKRKKPVLNNHQLYQLGLLLLNAEKFYGHPVDIEWALVDDVFYLLQARPITRIPPNWTRDEAAERFPNVVTPLTWDFVERGFHLSLNHSLALMGLPPYSDKWFALFDNYIYGNQNAVEIYAERLPFGFDSLADFEDKIPDLLARFAWVWDLPVAWARNLDRYLMRLGRIEAKVEKTDDLAELWALVLELQKTGEDYFLPNIAISITQRTLHRLVFMLINGVAGPERATWFMDAVMAGCETKTGAVNKDLMALARAISRRGALADKISGETAAEFLAGASFSACPEIARQFDLFLEDHGHREVDYDPYIPTWRDAPEHVVDLIKAMLPHVDEATSIDEPRVVASRAEEDLLALAPDGLRVALRELIRLTRSYTALDDLEHYQTTRLYIPFRRLMFKIGRILMAMDVVGEAGDIFFSRLDVLRRAVESGGFGELKNFIITGKADYIKNSQRSPKWNLDESQADENLTDNRLKGIAGSPGQAEGPVFIVSSADDFAAFPKGAVLVARTTNPAWTPLFYKAAAVITESGGPLSHGAVTAREMGLPAVMAVRDLFRYLVNGQKVRVLGREGIVEILD